MNKSRMTSMIPFALRAYASTLFESQRQVRNLRKAFPDAVDSEVYEFLLGQCLPTNGTSSSERTETTGKNASPTIPPDGTKKTATRFHEILSSWRSANPSAKRADWPGVDDVPLLFGSVWTVRADASPVELGWGITDNLPMVVLAETVDADADPPLTVQVFPLSIWPEFASDMDLLVSDPPLPQPMMVEVWNEQPMLPGQLFNCLGALSAEHLGSLSDLACAARTGTWTVGEGLVRKVHRGPPIVTGDDSRRLFQQIELLRTLPLRVPALARMTRPTDILLVDFAAELGLETPARMAASSRAPERPLRTAVLHSDSPPVRLAISECVSPEHLAIEVLSDVGRATQGATVLNDAGEPLGVIPENGTVKIARPRSSQIAIRRANGAFLNLRKAGD